MREISVAGDSRLDTVGAAETAWRIDGGAQDATPAYSGGSCTSTGATDGLGVLVGNRLRSAGSAHRAVKVGTGLALVVAVVVATALLSARVHSADAARSTAAAHAAAVEDVVQVLSLDVQNAETSQRGYLITDSATFLLAYRLSTSQVMRDLRRLAPAGLSQAEVRRLTSLVRSRLDELSHTTALELRGQHQRAVQAVTSGRGEQIAFQLGHQITRAQLADSKAAGLSADAAKRAGRLLRGELAAVAALVLGMLLAVALSRTWRWRVANLVTTTWFRLFFAEAPTGMAVLALGTPRPGAFLEVNRALCRMTGYTADELRRLDIVTIGHPEDRPLLAGSLHAALTGSDGSGSAERRWVRADGRILPVILSIAGRDRPVGRPGTLVAHVIDITDQKAAEERLLHEALHDPLTGLANRALYWDLLHQALSRARRRSTGTGILYLDLDSFKAVNDTYGHHVGDQVLRTTAARLRAALRVSDSAARLGGDEFAVLAEDIVDLEALKALQRRVRAAITEPIQVPGHEDLTITPSIGAVWTDAVNIGPEELTRLADEAMYAAKSDDRRAS